MRQVSKKEIERVIYNQSQKTFEILIETDRNSLDRRI